MKIAIDFETFLISDDGSLPQPVCLSSYDGTNLLLFNHSEVEGFLLSLPDDAEIIAHNLAFEFGVIHKYYPNLRPWLLNKLNTKKAWCTKIAEQIGDLRRVKSIGSYSLASLAKHYLSLDLSESKKDTTSWRFRYSELFDIPTLIWPQEAIDYALNDSLYTYQIREKQMYTDYNSIGSDFILSLATDLGLGVDQERVSSLKEELIKKRDPLLHWLVAHGYGYFDKKGVFKKQSKKFREYVETFGEDLTEKTPDLKISISKKGLSKLAADPVVKNWSDFALYEKLLSTYIPPLANEKGVIRAQFNPVVRTGRTSSTKSSLFHSLNLQNLPRSGGVRECLKARDGYKFVSIDYASIELVSVAQQLFNVYHTSSMKDKLNFGDTPVDLHSMTGSVLMSLDEGRDISYDEFIANKHLPMFKHFRTLAKPINLGYPGGIGPAKMIELAADQYNVHMSIKDARALKKTFFRTYPELERFLKDDVNSLKTGDQITWKAKNSQGEVVVQSADEYFYRVGDFFRRGCFFNSACNGFLMQTPTALGAKKAIFDVGCLALRSNDTIRVLGFIHDELILEIKDDENLKQNIEDISYLMCDSMKTIMKDVRVAVEASVSDRWSKDDHEWSKLYWRN